MSSKAYLRRASINEAQLMSEMKSWGKNKAMERKMEQRNEMMDKHLASRKKTQEYEKHLLSKNLEKNVMSTTMTTEEYLDRSQSKYASWKERERERLERRYVSLNRSYMKEFKQLGLHTYKIPDTEIHRRKSESDILKEEVEDELKPEPNVELPPSLQETEREAKVDANDKDVKDSVNDEGSNDVKEVEVEEKNDTVSDVSVKRMLMRQHRRATVTSIPKKDRPILTNTRLDRRPSMPFSAIPYNFGK